MWYIKGLETFERKPKDDFQGRKRVIWAYEPQSGMVSFAIMPGFCIFHFWVCSESYKRKKCHQSPKAHKALIFTQDFLVT